MLPLKCVVVKWGTLPCWGFAIFFGALIPGIGPLEGKSHPSLCHCCPMDRQLQGKCHPSQCHLCPRNLPLQGGCDPSRCHCCPRERDWTGLCDKRLWMCTTPAVSRGRAIPTPDSHLLFVGTQKKRESTMPCSASSWAQSSSTEYLLTSCSEYSTLADREVTGER
jgi:hypothetical protein